MLDLNPSVSEAPPLPNLTWLPSLAPIPNSMLIAKSVATPFQALLVPPTSGTTFLPREDSSAVLMFQLVAKALLHAALPEQILDLEPLMFVLPPVLMLHWLLHFPLVLNSTLTAKPMVKPSLVYLVLPLFGIILLVKDMPVVLGFLLVEEAILLAVTPPLPLPIAMLVSPTPETVLKLSPGLNLTLAPAIMLNTDISATMLLVWPSVALLVVLNLPSFTGKALPKDSDTTIEALPQVPSFSSELDNTVMLVSQLVMVMLSPLTSMVLVL